MSLAPRRRPAPRLVVKILGFSFAVIALVLAAVFLTLSWQIRERLTRAIIENMEAGQTRFAALEARRQRERRTQAATLAENPTLKAAVDIYYTERHLDDLQTDLLSTIRSNSPSSSRASTCRPCRSPTPAASSWPAPVRRPVTGRLAIRSCSARD